MQELNLNEENAANYYLAALILFTISRFICTALMNIISAKQLLSYLSLVAMALCALTMFGSGYIGVFALIGISACMSMMFPTIFGLASEGLGQDRKMGGSGLIMAILGGAVLPLIMGQVSDAANSINLAFIVPLLCFAVVIYYARSAGQKTATIV